MHTSTDPVPQNGEITTAERHLGGDARAYEWRSFDPVSDRGLFVTLTKRRRGDDADGLGIAGPNGLVATLTCARDLRCSPKDDWLPYRATLGPGADEVTVESGDGTAQVIGYDGTLRRTLDLGATVTGGERVGGLRWTADGRRLAVVSYEYLRRGRTASRVWLFDADGGGTRLVYSVWSGASRTRPTSGFDGRGTVWTSSDWGWSLDGHALLLDVRTRGLYGADVVVLRLQPDSAAQPVIARTLFHSDRHFDWAGNVAWSPDGTKIAVRTRHDVTEISAEDGGVVARHPHRAGWLIWTSRPGHQ